MTNECEWCHIIVPALVKWESQTGQSICPNCWAKQKQWLANMQVEQEMKKRLEETILSEEEEAILYWKKFFNDLPLIRNTMNFECFICKRSAAAPYTERFMNGRFWRELMCPNCGTYHVEAV